MDELEAIDSVVLPETEQLERQQDGSTATDDVLSTGMEIAEVASSKVEEARLFDSTPPRRHVPSGWQEVRRDMFVSSHVYATCQNELEALYDADWALLGKSEQPLWAVEQTALLCSKGEEGRFQGKAELLKTDRFTSAADAVSCLNTHDGHMACPEGFCIVFSESMQKYLVVYRRDKKDRALGLFGLVDDGPKARVSHGDNDRPSSHCMALARCAFFGSESHLARGGHLEHLFDDQWTQLIECGEPLWALEQTAALCLRGQEERFEGKAELLKTDEFTSVSYAVHRLNTLDGHVACPEGFCIVLSQSKQRYFVLYRKDKKEKVFDLFDLADDASISWQRKSSIYFDAASESSFHSAGAAVNLFPGQPVLLHLPGTRLDGLEGTIVRSGEEESNWEVLTSMGETHWVEADKLEAVFKRGDIVCIVDCDQNGSPDLKGQHGIVLKPAENGHYRVLMRDRTDLTCQSWNLRLAAVSSEGDCFNLLTLADECAAQASGSSSRSTGCFSVKDPIRVRRIPQAARLEGMEGVVMSWEEDLSLWKVHLRDGTSRLLEAAHMAHISEEVDSRSPSVASGRKWCPAAARSKDAPPMPLVTDPRLSVASHTLLKRVSPHHSLQMEVDGAGQGLGSWHYYYVMCFSSVCAAVLSFLVDVFTYAMSFWRGYLQLYVSNGKMICIVFNVFFVILARLAVRREAAAVGTGIPEVKTMLFGHVGLVNEFLRMRVLWIKTFALSSVVGAGLPIGKEGPFVHLACCLSHCFHGGDRQEDALMTPLLLASCAVGVGVAFSAPLGGVIFALELMLPQVYEMHSYLGCFLSSIMGSVVFAGLRSFFSSNGQALTPLISSDVEPGEGVPEKHPLAIIILNCCLGAICGMLGPLFVKCHRTCQHIMKNWWEQGMEAGVVQRQDESKRARKFSVSTQGIPISEPLLGGNREGHGKNVTWAADTEDGRSKKDMDIQTFACMRNCVARDIILVCAVTVVNSYLAESLPLLSQGKSMPALMSQLFSKKLDQTVDTWAVPGLGGVLTILVVFLVRWVMTFLAVGLPISTGVVTPTLILGALLGRLFAYMMPMWIQNWLLSTEVNAFSYNIPPASPDAIGAFAARFAIVGAGAFCAAVTGCYSMAITVFEVLALPNSVLPLACASLVAIQISSDMGHGFFDQCLIDNGWHGISAMASRKFSQAPASKVMKPYIDFRSECCPRFASLCDIKRFLDLPRENLMECPSCEAERPEEIIPIVQYSRNRFWGAKPLLAGATTVMTMQQVLDARQAHYDPEHVVDFLDPMLLGEQASNSKCWLERTPLRVDAMTPIKDVFVLLKVTSSYKRLRCYVTSKGRLLGVITQAELLGRGAEKAT